MHCPKIAPGYLGKEPIPKLAAEYGMNPGNLHKTLMTRCGPEWSIEFKVEELNIHEVVPFMIPALLDPKIIEAVRSKAKANKTYSHGQNKHEYLLSRMVFCGHCGYAMFGQASPNGSRLYYRHSHTHRVKECSRPKAWVDANQLEDAVIRHLFECFGNPKAVEVAIRAATPNPEQVNELLEQRTRIATEIEKAKQGKVRVMRLVNKGLLEESDAETELVTTRKRIEQANEELGLIDNQLADMPTGERLKKFASGVSKRYVSARLIAKRETANSALEKMTWDEKRALVEMVFDGKLTDGKRMGVYIDWIDGEEKRRKKRWKYTIVGHLIDDEGQIPMSDAAKDSFTFGAAWKQKDLNSLARSSDSA